MPPDAVVTPPIVTAPAPAPEPERERTPVPPVPAVPDDPSAPCPPGMAWVPAGTYTTGMESPDLYAIVDTTVMEVVEYPERQCPDALKRDRDAIACWVQTDLHDPVVTRHEVEVNGYCMDRLPFPGGGPYAPDGMSTWDAERLEEMLETGYFGPRRLCGYTEYELAVAGPTTNQRFVYGDTPNPDACADSEKTEIGAMESCRNAETGLAEYGAVISQWVRLDETLVDWACGPEGASQDACRASGGAQLTERRDDGSFTTRYIVAGGTRRVQTRQAPFTPHTFHDHGQVTGQGGCDSWGWDDGPAICATPDPAYARCRTDENGPGCAQVETWETRWEDLRTWCRGRRMTDCLNRGSTAALGRPVDVCPERPDELGPGQGR